MFVAATLAERELRRQFESGNVISVEVAEKQAERQIRDMEDRLWPGAELSLANQSAAFVLRDLARDPRDMGEIFPQQIAADATQPAA